MDRADTGLYLEYGTYEEARSWVGRSAGPRACEDEVNHAAIKYFCSLVQDGSPNYWHEEEARQRWGARR